MPALGPSLRSQRATAAPALQAGRRALWAMPLLQVGWLAFFLADAVIHFWYNWWLLLPCFLTGELGPCVDGTHGVTMGHCF